MGIEVDLFKLRKLFVKNLFKLRTQSMTDVAVLSREIQQYSYLFS
jgi:hypothetical protein